MRHNYSATLMKQNIAHLHIVLGLVPPPPFTHTHVLMYEGSLWISTVWNKIDTDINRVVQLLPLLD